MRLTGFYLEFTKADERTKLVLQTVDGEIFCAVERDGEQNARDATLAEQAFLSFAAEVTVQAVTDWLRKEQLKARALPEVPLPPAAPNPGTPISLPEPEAGPYGPGAPNKV